MVLARPPVIIQRPSLRNVIMSVTVVGPRDMTTDYRFLCSIDRIR